MPISEQSYRFRMLSAAKSLYYDSGLYRFYRGLYRCCSCHNPLSGGFFGFSVVGGSVVVRGRNHCHNRACCPVCSYPKQRRMMSDICHGIWTHRHNGGGVYLVTLTFSHGLGDDLGVIQYLLGQARQSMYRQGGFRGELRSMGYRGRVVDYEIQLLGRNGAHPHTHELVFCDAGMDVGEIQELYDKYWVGALYGNGLSARVGVACKVTGYDGVGDYITKMGSEVCLSNFSKESWGGGSLSPMKVLCRYMETGDVECANAWLDYVFNIKGKRIIGFSRGLRGFLGLDDFKDFSDDESGLYDCDLIQVRLDDVSRLSMAEWWELCGEVENGGLQDVLAELNRLHISYDVKGGGLNRYREMLDCRMSGAVVI